MVLQNFGMSFGSNVLFDHVNMEFPDCKVSHILGSNGVGKSSFGKACVGMIDYTGTMTGNENAILISSGSNVPGEFCLDDIGIILRRKFSNAKMDLLYSLLGLDKLSNKLPIRKMSDGQKQKVKLFCFLNADPKLIILDEFTNALDKNSSVELYKFFEEYVNETGVTVLNITHNLSDLEYLDGEYFYVSQKNIRKVSDKQEVIASYVRGE